MLSIYKKELKLYSVTAVGYVFLAFMLLSAGIYTSLVNFVYYSPAFEYVVKDMCFVLLIAIPLLTMRVFSDEKKQKTDKLLCLLPIDVKSIVLGKFFALATITLIPALVLCIYPFILTMYGVVNIKSALSCIFAFYLLECTLCSIGMFTSSLTENQIIAAILCFGILLIAYLIPSISGNISSASAFSFKAFTVCAVLICAVIFFVTKKWVITLIAACIMEIPLAVIYLKFNSFLTGKFTAFVQCFSVFGKIDSFTNGVFDLTAVVYFVSITALFICLTIQSENKRRWR